MSKENKRDGGCGLCGKTVKEREEGVQCEYCEKWYHKKCEKIGDQMYEMLQNEDGVKWFCNKCREVDVIGELRKWKAKMENGLLDLGSKLDSMGGQVEKIRKVSVDADELEKIRSEMRTLRSEIVNKKDFIEFKKGVEKLKKDVVDKGELEAVKVAVSALKNGDGKKVDVGSEVRKTFAEIMESERQREEREMNSRAKEREMEMKMKEAFERDKRKFNVVLMGVPEVSDEEDLNVARKMLDVIVEEIKVDFEVIGRIGRKGERQRPLRIKLKDMEDRRRVLARAKNLKKADGMQGYYIVPDLTKIQQEDDKKLRNEVRRLREAGNTFARISRGVVVTEARESNSRISLTR